MIWKRQFIAISSESAIISIAEHDEIEIKYILVLFANASFKIEKGK